jgi:molecular chaperone GrpE
MNKQQDAYRDATEAMADGNVDPSAVVDEALAAETQAETRDEAMDRLRSEVEDANNRVLMAQADLENFRKRMRRDMEDQIRFAALPVVADLLEVRDNLVRAIEAVATAGGEANAGDGLRDGVQMLVKQFDITLGKHGIKPIHCVGEVFDPNLHQAITQMPSAQHPSGSIAHEAVTGFQMHVRVVRPSQVIVSTGPA